MAAFRSLCPNGIAGVVTFYLDMVCFSVMGLPGCSLTGCFWVMWVCTYQATLLAIKQDPLEQQPITFININLQLIDMI